MVSKDSKIFHRLFTLQIDILIFIIIKYRDIWLKSEFSLSLAKYEEIVLFFLIFKVSLFAVSQSHNLRSSKFAMPSSELRLLYAYKIFVSSANKKNEAFQNILGYR